MKFGLYFDLDKFRQRLEFAFPPVWPSESKPLRDEINGYAIDNSGLKFDTAWVNLFHQHALALAEVMHELSIPALRCYFPIFLLAITDEEFDDNGVIESSVASFLIRELRGGTLCKTFTLNQCSLIMWWLREIERVFLEWEARSDLSGDCDPAPFHADLRGAYRLAMEGDDKAE